MTVKKGDKVQVEYTGTFEDGTVFDSSEKHGKPLEFESGKGMVIKGFEDAIMGMKEGEEKEVKLEPKDAYGEPNPQLVQKVPREHLPAEHEPKEGMMMLITLPTGQQMPARIESVTKDEVGLDLNHPFAGRVLNFKLKVVKIN